MMRWITGASLRSRGLVLGLAVVAIVAGAVQLRSMPRDVLPEFGPPTVEVQTEALGLSALEVEQLITVPLEQDLLNGVAFLDVIRSESVPGLSRVQLIFEAGTDLARARQVVNERLTQSHGLPQVAKPPQMLQPLSSTSRLMMIGVSSRSLSLIDLSVLARWTIRPRLMGVPGVANVAVWGNRERQLQVQVNPQTLQARDVSLEEVIRTTGNALWVSPLTFLEASTPGVPGFIDTPNQRLNVQHLLPIKTPDQLAQVIIERVDRGVPPAAPPGAAATEEEAAAPTTTTTTLPPRLGEVARVVEDHQPLIGDAVFTDGTGLLLVVEKFPEANALEVTRGVENALEALAPGLSGVQFDPSFYRPATYIERSTENLRSALLIGFGLVVLLFVAFFAGWRRALVGVVTIVTALAAAVLVLWLRGETINAMVVAGLVLALAVLVDDAVAGTENVWRRVRQHRLGGGDGSTANVVLQATLEGRSPLAYGTAIIVLALLPVFVLRGEAGEFLPPVALSYVGAVLASLVAALTVAPALSLLLLSGGRVESRELPPLRWLRRRYDGLMRRITGKTLPAVAVFAVILLVGVAPLSSVKRGESLVPEFKDTNVLVHWRGAPGTSLPEMNRISARVGRELAALPGVSKVGGHVGRAVMADQIVGANDSELWVTIDADADYDETLASIQEVLDGYPGLEHAALTYPKDRIREVLTEGTEGDVTVRLYGQDLGVLRGKAEEVRRLLAGVDGVANPRVQQEAQEPTVEVEVDLAAAQRAGIKPGDVRRAAATLLSGIQVGNLFERQKVFDVVVWGAPEVRDSLGKIRDVLIDRPAGGRVRLGDVAQVRIAPSPSVIRHDAVSRSMDVSADVRGRDVDDVADDIEDRLDGLTFPLEHHAELLGGYAERQSAQQRFVAASLAAAIGVFLVLQAAFASWRLAAIAFLTLPAALAGGVVAAAIDGDPLSIGSVMGFFGVFGLAVRNTLLLVRRSQYLAARDDRGFGPEVVRRAAVERMAPTLMAAVAVAAAFLPIAVVGDVPGQEVVHPMSVVLLGGIATSTLVSLFALPGLIAGFGPRGRPPEIGLEEPFAERLEPVGATAAPAAPGPTIPTTQTFSRVSRAWGALARRHRPRRLLPLLLMAALPALAGCADAGGDAAKPKDPARIEPVAGTNLSRVIVTQKAAERLGIQVAPIATEEIPPGSGTRRTVVPYAAILYDPRGDTWVYTNPSPLTYVRQRIAVERIDGSRTLVTEGPPEGTPVVTVGAAELYGIEFGVGK